MDSHLNVYTRGHACEHTSTCIYACMHAAMCSDVFTHEVGPHLHVLKSPQDRHRWGSSLGPWLLDPQALLPAQWTLLATTYLVHA